MIPEFRNACAILLILILLVTAGCRDKTVSPSSNDNLFVERFPPEHSWSGIQLSFDTSSRDSWEAALSRNFVYYPDPTSQEKYPAIFEEWDLPAELDFLSTLFSGDFEFEAHMLPNNYEPPNPTGTIVIWESVEYSILVGNNGSYPAVYGGFANIEFQLEGNYWYIISWRDLHGSSAPWNPEFELPTTGELRAGLASIE